MLAYNESERTSFVQLYTYILANEQDIRESIKGNTTVELADFSIVRSSTDSPKPRYSDLKLSATIKVSNVSNFDQWVRYRR